MPKALLRLFSALLIFAILIPECLAEISIIGGSVSEQELLPGERIRESGSHAVTFDNAAWFSDTHILEGYWYPYLDSRENGAPRLRYYWPVGTHTPAMIDIEYTNMTKEKVSALDNVKCRIVYDDLYEFDTFATQLNPNQTADDGKSWPSIDAVPVEPLITVTLRFFASIPLAVRDSSKPLVAYVTINDDAVYTVDLREYIELN